MAYTVNQTVTDIQEHYPDCTTAKAIRLINKAVSLVLQDVDGYSNTESINLTAATHTYALANQYARVLDVSYLASATSAKSLIPWSADEMDQEMRGLRAYDPSSGTPTKYFIEPSSTTAATHPVTLRVRLYPVPDTTTSAGYPVLKVTGSTYVALTAGGDLPNWILDQEWIIQEACWRLASEAQKWQEMNERKAVAKEMRERHARMLKGIQSGTNTHIDFPFGQGDVSY